MDQFFKMDVFFFISAVMTVILGSLFAVVLWKLIGILNTVERIANAAEKGVDTIAHDVEKIRGEVKKQEERLGSLFTAIFKGVAKVIAPKKRKRS